MSSDSAPDNKAEPAVKAEAGDGLFHPDLLAGSKMCTNTAQVYICTTEDKLSNLLNKFREAHSKVLAWGVPLGIFVSIFCALFTASFRNALGLSASVWEAIFVISLFLSLIWTVLAVIRAIACRKEATVETLITKIKNSKDSK